ncbi:MAG: beta-propeller domain-containing protein, partial [Myxococcota bacterium]
MNHRTASLALAISAAFASTTTGCSNSVETDPRPVGTRTSSLTRAADCAGLLSLLKADARQKMNDAIDAEIFNVEHWDDDGWGFALDGGATPAAGPPQAGGEEDSAANGASRAPTEYSETNNQVAGVDEADIVKTDGEYLYALHGQELSILAAWPAASLNVGSDTAIEGYPVDMFVTPGRAVVFSAVDGHSVNSAAGVTPSCGAFGGYYTEPAIGVDAYYPCYQPFTKMTVIDINGVNAVVTAEHYLEGDYKTARRQNEMVRVIINEWGWRGPEVQLYAYDVDWDDEAAIIARLEQLRRQNEQTIAQSTLADYVPHQYTKVNGALVAEPISCGDVYVPGAGSTDHGLTTISTLDLNAPNDHPENVRIMGAAQTVYQSADALYLASDSWDDFRMSNATDATTPVSLNNTPIHKFDLAPNSVSYRASGQVDGSLHNQFSLDEQGGILRVATTDNVVSATMWDTQNHLFTLGPNLEALGSVRGLAPGERIFSARFVGDRGYVVTFRQVDPLFVFDLSQPSQPQLLAELKIPGFSEYMHPIEGGDYLLTIGRDGDENGATTWGETAFQIFDVRNPTDPQLIHKTVVEGDSEASYDHRAFTFFGDMLAVPFTSWNEGSSSVSQLRLFDVSPQ